MSNLSREARHAVWNLLSRVPETTWPQEAPVLARGRITPPQIEQDDGESYPIIMVKADEEDGNITSGKAGPPVIETIIRMDVDVFVRSFDESTLMDLLDDYDTLIRETLLTDAQFVQDYEGLHELSSEKRYTSMGEPFYGQLMVQVVLVASERHEIIVPEDLRGMNLQVDMADPGDGPDGRIEAEVRIDF